MTHPRLFFIAPDNVHLSLHYDYSDGYWALRAASTIRNEHGEYELVGERVYEGLTVEEALEVAAEDLRHRIDPDGRSRRCYE